MEAKVVFDLHCHSHFSRDARPSVSEMAAAAKAKGLKTIGISDHGPAHFRYGFKESQIPEIKAEIEEARKLDPDFNIQFGIETNIINPDGSLDLPKDKLDQFDYVIAGYHYATKGKEDSSYIKTHISAILSGETTSKRRTVINTDLITAALYENNIQILAHPGDKLPVDIRAVAKACEETHTLMEINNAHDALSAQDIKICSLYDVKFIIGSDAHKIGEIGTYDWALARIFSAQLPLERVVNIQTDISEDVYKQLSKHVGFWRK